VKPKIKRIATDIAGYGLIILGVAFGWLPGPGGIPLVLAGLGLLSINNAWARKLRKVAARHSGKVAHILFPDIRWIQWGYDIIVVALLCLVGVFSWRHAAVWQISLAVFLFFMALLIAGLNRDRYGRVKRRIRHH
jgi:hypothetical protein